MMRGMSSVNPQSYMHHTRSPIISMYTKINPPTTSKTTFSIRTATHKEGSLHALLCRFVAVTFGRVHHDSLAAQPLLPLMLLSLAVHLAHAARYLGKAPGLLGMMTLPYPSWSDGAEDSDGTEKPDGAERSLFFSQLLSWRAYCSYFYLHYPADMPYIRAG